MGGEGGTRTLIRKDVGTRMEFRMSPQTTIYMPLRDEGTDVWAPVFAEMIGPNHYRLISSTSNIDEWQFGGIGQVVRVESRIFSGGDVRLAIVGLGSDKGR